MEKETSEIVKLTERISKDPKSKLFVPLAEEYKKAGDIEMAIHVLSEGLKNNPTYVTARSLLGRFLLETGDLEAARKELEEVVKAIPDNLLAQRKLGDLYILQERRDDALQHYKIALSLNPGDAEFASLISDVEAGVDVRSRLQQQKTKPATAAVSRQQPKPPMVNPAQPVTTSPAITPPEPEQPAPSVSKIRPEQIQPRATALPAEKAPKAAEQKAKPASEVTGALSGSEERAAPERGKIPAEAAEQPAVEQKPVKEAVAIKTEEPEEILVVEQLEEEQPVAVIPPSDLEVFAEKIAAEMPEVTAEDQAGAVTVAPEPVLAVPEPVKEPEPALPAAESPIQPLVPESERASDQADDFTTDTLAELYIAQGFYEKAISIYERMLADKPDSKGLKDKLERVRAMAVQAEEPPVDAEQIAAITGKKSDTDIFSEAREYVPPAAIEEAGEEIAIPPADMENLIPVPGEEAREYVPPEEITNKEEELAIDAELLVESDEISQGAKTWEKPLEENMFSAAKEYIPPVKEEGGPRPEEAEKGISSAFMVQPDQGADQRNQPPYTDFEPREYIPPTAAPREGREEKVTVDLKQPGATKKEAIDRLEHWLKNIKKEK
jgi:tetratricopeptide (TPR) repeat protein